MALKILCCTKWEPLIRAILLCCCGGLVSSIDHYDTAYTSSQECALMLKKTRYLGLSDPLVGYSNYYKGEEADVAQCIRYEDVNEALRMAKKQLGYVPRDRNLASTDNNVLDRIANVILETSRNLAQRFQLTFEEITYGLPTIETSKTDIWDICPDMVKPTPCAASRFRTYDGECSSLKNSVIGKARTAYNRFLPPAYSDGISSQKVSPVDGSPLPYVRKLSLKVHPDISQLSNRRSALLFSWGEFLGHDIYMSDNAREPDGSQIQCCPSATTNPHPNCNPIPISENDPFYWRYNSTCMEFQRNLAGIRPGCALGPRITSNFVSSRLDGSVLYGNSESEARNLRQGSKGLMRMWPKYRHLGLKDLLPPMTEMPENNCIGRTRNKYCFLSGDSRASIQPHTTALHHAYVREHNRIATELGYLNPHWDDERIFQETRHIIAAVIQHITYNELLPLLVGPEFMRMYNLTLQKEGYWHGYDKNVVLGTDLTGPTAALRWGHTMMHDKFSLYDKNHEFVESWELHTVVGQPFNMYQPGAIDKVIGGMVNSPPETFDRYLVSGMIKRVFQGPDMTFGLDVASLNINRGRDNAIPGYNEYREWCGMPRAKTFEELEYYLGNWTALQYSKIYKHPDEIDLWSAGIAEYLVPGGFIGPTFACIISRQFNRNRRGDRFWYENPGFPSSFTPGQLQEIRKVTQAKILCENADDFPTIQKWVLLLPHPNENPRYFCKDLPQINLEYWREDPAANEFKYLK